MSWLSLILSNIVLSSLLALLAVYVQRRLKMPAIARVLWLLVLVKLVTPPLVNLPLAKLPPAMACTMGLCNCGHVGLQFTLMTTAIWALLVAWITGALVTAWNAWRRWRHFQRLTAKAKPAPDEWQAAAAKLAAKLSLQRTPIVLSVPGRLPPLVVSGWRRSRMLLPADLLDQLNEHQREALLLHELAHIKRCDHLVRILEFLVGIAYWWLPVVRSIGRQLRACEETCCDRAVVSFLPQARRDYAKLLLDVVEFVNPLPSPAAPQATAMGTAGDLEQRMRGILDASPTAQNARPTGALVLGLALAIVPCQLHYEFVAPVTLESDSKPSCEPATNVTSMPLDDRCAPISSFVCPS